MRARLPRSVLGTPSRFFAFFTIAIAYFLIAANLFAPADRGLQYLFGQVLRFEARDDSTVIVTRPQLLGSESAGDRRSELAGILEELSKTEAGTVVILDSLAGTTTSHADNMLYAALQRLDGRAVVLIDWNDSLSNLEGLGEDALPLALFRQVARTGHNAQPYSLSPNFDSVSITVETERHGTLRHVAVEALGDEYDFERFVPVDGRAYPLQVRTMPSDQMLSDESGSSLSSDTIVIVEPVANPPRRPLSHLRTRKEFAENIALQIYTLRNEPTRSVLMEPFSLLLPLLIIIVLSTKFKIRGIQALSYSSVWILVCFLAVALKVYLPILGPVVFLLLCSTLNIEREAELVGLEKGRRVHPSSGLPNALAFREAAFPEGAVAFALQSERLQLEPSEAQLELGRLGDEVIFGPVYHITDATLVTLISSMDALRLADSMIANAAELQGVHGAFFVTERQASSGSVVAVLERTLSAAKSADLPFMVANDNGGREGKPFVAVDEEEPRVAQPLAEEPLFDLFERRRAGLKVTIPSTPNALFALQRSIETQSRKNEQVGGRLSLWISIDHALLRDQVLVESLCVTVSKHVKQGMSIVLMVRRLNYADSALVLLDGLRRLSRAGVTICHSGLDNQSNSLTDLLRAPAQIMSLGARDLDASSATKDYLGAAERFCRNLSRELYLENVDTFGVAQIASGEGIRYASGPAVAEFLLQAPPRASRNS